MNTQWFSQVAFTLTLIVLIALAMTDLGNVFAAVLLASIATGAAFLYVAFPGSRFFSIVLANFLGVYACIFLFFMVTNFRPVTPWIGQVGFVLPIFAFIAGAWWRRRDVRAIVTANRLRDERHFSQNSPVAGAGVRNWGAHLPASGSRIGPGELQRRLLNGDGGNCHHRPVSSAATSPRFSSTPGCSWRSSFHVSLG